jgi:hypothetical protein
VIAGPFEFIEAVKMRIVTTEDAGKALVFAKRLKAVAELLEKTVKRSRAKSHETPKKGSPRLENRKVGGLYPFRA